jgi:putative membrane protein
MDPKSFTRPAPELFSYYLIIAICTLPAVVLVLPALWFRYITLRYALDDEGVSMRWGVLFRRETVLTYRRIQDIHLTRDLLQRWLGIATVSIQTASGSGLPEIKLEGVRESDAEVMRDFLYQQMRGSRSGVMQGLSIPQSTSVPEVTRLLTDIRDNLARMLPPEKPV